MIQKKNQIRRQLFNRAELITKNFDMGKTWEDWGVTLWLFEDFHKTISTFVKMEVKYLIWQINHYQYQIAKFWRQQRNEGQ